MSTSQALLYGGFMLLSGIGIGISLHYEYLLYCLTHKPDAYFDQLIRELRRRAKGKIK